MAQQQNYAGVSDNSGIPQSGVYDVVSGTAVPIAAGTVTKDANHGNQPSAPVQVQLAGTSASSGHVILDANTIATYAASITGLAPAASPTDIFTITGGVGKVVRITRIAISASTNSAAAATNDVQFIIRSAANTGGTSASATAVPYDSADPAAVATVLSYTANPGALGAAVGTIYAAKLVPTINPYTATDFPTQAPLIVQFGITDSKPVVLRGTAQVFAVNLNAVSLTGTASVDISIEWTESVN